MKFFTVFFSLFFFSHEISYFGDNKTVHFMLIEKLCVSINNWLVKMVDPVHAKMKPAKNRLFAKLVTITVFEIVCPSLLSCIALHSATGWQICVTKK